MTNMDEARTVLRVIVENMLYPVTIDVLKQIFSRFGQVLKIVTFNKNSNKIRFLRQLSVKLLLLFFTNISFLFQVHSKR